MIAANVEMTGTEQWNGYRKGATAQCVCGKIKIIDIHK